jgi:hypothetical protein
MPAATTPPTQRSSTSPTGSPTGGCAEDATSPTPPGMTDRKLRAVASVGVYPGPCPRATAASGFSPQRALATDRD